MKTQFKNGKTQFKNTKTQFENAKTQFSGDPLAWTGRDRRPKKTPVIAILRVKLGTYELQGAMFSPEVNEFSYAKGFMKIQQVV